MFPSLVILHLTCQTLSTRDFILMVGVPISSISDFQATLAMWPSLKGHLFRDHSYLVEYNCYVFFYLVFRVRSVLRGGYQYIVQYFRDVSLCLIVAITAKIL